MRGDLGGVEGVEDGVALQAGARPLGVVDGLGVGGESFGSGELLFDCEDGEGGEFALVREVGRAASLGLVGDVDGVAAIEEVGGPALTAVGGVEPVLGGSVI